MVVEHVSEKHTDSARQENGKGSVLVVLDMGSEVAAKETGSQVQANATAAEKVQARMWCSGKSWLGLVLVELVVIGSL